LTSQIENWSPLEDDGFIGLVGPMLVNNGAQGHFRFLAEPKHKNRGGFVQGGMLMTFADRALGITSRLNDPSRVQSTVQFDMHFMRAVRIGEAVDIHCRVVRETRSLVFLEGELAAGDETVATAKGVWKIISRERG
jgi:acyl-coenzyme A thioesterase PaaI-like protein